MCYHNCNSKLNSIVRPPNVVVGLAFLAFFSFVFSPPIIEAHRTELNQTVFRLQKRDIFENARPKFGVHSPYKFGAKNWLFLGGFDNFAII